MTHQEIIRGNQAPSAQELAQAFAVLSQQCAPGDRPALLHQVRDRVPMVLADQEEVPPVEESA